MNAIRRLPPWAIAGIVVAGLLAGYWLWHRSQNSSVSSADPSSQPNLAGSGSASGGGGDQGPGPYTIPNLAGLLGSYGSSGSPADASAQAFQSSSDLSPAPQPTLVPFTSTSSTSLGYDPARGYGSDVQVIPGTQSAPTAAPYTIQTISPSGAGAQSTVFTNPATQAQEVHTSGAKAFAF